MNNKSCLLFGGIAAAIVILAIAIAYLACASAYNDIVAKDEKINGAWAQVETVLQRRYDLIPNLVNTVKGFAEHEKELLTEVTRLRSQWGAAKSQGDKIQTSQQLESALGRLMVVVERYPQLKADQNFRALQDELVGTENRISVERRRFNQSVEDYNRTIRQLPEKFIASFAGFEKRDEYFKADQQAAQAPKVEF